MFVVVLINKLLIFEKQRDGGFSSRKKTGEFSFVRMPKWVCRKTGLW